jgi:hypothetical protein
MIHTAAHIYYYGSRFGLTSPPTNSFWRKQMKIAAREQNGVSSHVHQRRWIHLAQIHIKKMGGRKSASIWNDYTRIGSRSPLGNGQKCL